MGIRAFFVAAFIATVAALLAGAGLALIAQPAHSQTVYFTDNFDGYTSNSGLPNGPWHSDSTLANAPANTPTSTTQAFSAPNSIICEAGGNPNTAFRTLGTTVSAMQISFKVWGVSWGTGAFGDPVGVACMIGGHVVGSGFSEIPAVVPNLTVMPPAGQVFVDVNDCNNVLIGHVTMSDTAWHQIDFSFSCTGTAGDFVKLVIDGVTQSLSATAQHAQSYDQVMIRNTGTGHVPPAGQYLDNFQAQSLAPPGQVGQGYDAD